MRQKRDIYIREKVALSNTRRVYCNHHLLSQNYEAWTRILTYKTFLPIEVSLGWGHYAYAASVLVCFPAHILSAALPPSTSAANFHLLNVSTWKIFQIQNMDLNLNPRRTPPTETIRTHPTRTAKVRRVFSRSMRPFTHHLFIFLHRSILQRNVPKHTNRELPRCTGALRTERWRPSRIREARNSIERTSESSRNF